MNKNTWPGNNLAKALTIANTKGGEFSPLKLPPDHTPPEMEGKVLDDHVRYLLWKKGRAVRHLSSTQVSQTRWLLREYGMHV